MDSALLTLKIADLGLPSAPAARRAVATPSGTPPAAAAAEGQTLMRTARSRCALAALLIAAGCSKDKDVEPPAQLVNFPAKLPVKELWGDKVGGGKKQVKLRLGLGPAIDNDLVFAASDKGELVAVNLETGRQVWLKKFKKMQLSAGPGAGPGNGGGGIDQGLGDCARGRERQGAVAHACEFRAALRAGDQREGRGDALGRWPAAWLRCSHRQGALVGGAASAAAEPARHGDSGDRQGGRVSAASTTAR